MMFALVLTVVGCGGSAGGSSSTGGGVTVIHNGNSVTTIVHDAGGAGGSSLVQYHIPAESMEPTLAVGSTINVDPTAYSNAQPQVGDIIVFHPPQGAVSSVNGQSCGVAVSPGQMCPRPTPQEASVKFVKRVVAGPGDTISIQDGHVIRNGKRQDDSFTRPCQPSDNCTYTAPIKVPDGYWFLLGDNRGQSDDSRFWGPVPTGWIIGKVVSGG